MGQEYLYERPIHGVSTQIYTAMIALWRRMPEMAEASGFEKTIGAMVIAAVARSADLPQSLQKRVGYTPREARYAAVPGLDVPPKARAPSHFGDLLRGFFSYRPRKPDQRVAERARISLEVTPHVLRHARPFRRGFRSPRSRRFSATRRAAPNLGLPCEPEVPVKVQEWSDLLRDSAPLLDAACGVPLDTPLGRLLGDYIFGCGRDPRRGSGGV